MLFLNVIIQYFILRKHTCYLLNVKTSASEEHKKTYDKFKKLMENTDKELLRIYDEETSKAEILIQIFFDEKRNRGRFTYNINSEANKPFAEASLKNAKIFCTAIKQLIENKQ